MRFIKYLILSLFSASTCFAQSVEPANGARLVPIGPGFAGDTINVVIFRKNSLTTHDSIQYASFYDQSGKLILAQRKIGEDHFEIHPTQFTGDLRDAHRDISIAVDGNGILHVAWDHHNVPLRYAHGLAAGFLNLSEKLPMTGEHENRVSYPEFYNLPDGGLLFIYRDGASGSGNLVMDRYDLPSGKWRQVHANLIDGQGKRNAYWQAAVDEAGTIHVSWVWRESPDVASNHDLCYARSTDGGETWTQSNGEKYALPITAETAEVAVKIPQNHELINQTSMTTDSKGRPFIATYWREEGSEIPQYHVVYHDGSKWQVSNVGQQTVAFRLGGTGTKRIPISRPQILADASNGADRAYILFRDDGRGSKVSIASCEDLGKGKWQVSDLTAGPVGMWEPTYDIALWQKQKIIHAMVQQAEQGDGEKVVDVPARMIYVLEFQPHPQGR